MLNIQLLLMDLSPNELIVFVGRLWFLTGCWTEGSIPYCACGPLYWAACFLFSTVMREREREREFASPGQHKVEACLFITLSQQLHPITSAIFILVMKSESLGTAQAQEEGMHRV